MAPFPYLPMTAVMASLLSMQIAELTLFSYVGYMLEHLGVVDDKDEAGYYAGFLASGFMIGTLLSSRFWGLVADRHGSRLVITCGLLSISIVSVAFGSAKNFTWAFVCRGHLSFARGDGVVTYKGSDPLLYEWVRMTSAITLLLFMARLLLGLFNSMETAAKTIVTDVCGTEHNTVCMGLLTSSWSLGSVLGPGVGGMLAEPARRFPQSFSEEGLFGRNPYLLSNVVGAGLALLALPLVFIFLKDTKAAQSSSSTTKGWLSSWWCCNRKDGGRGGDDTKEDCEPRHAPGARAESSGAFGEYGIRKQSWKQPETMPLTLKRTGLGRDGEEIGKQASGVKKESLLAQRHIRVLLFMDAVFSASFSGFDEVYALWVVSSTAKGGLDWSSSHVGQVFVACDLMVLAFELLAVPYLTPWLGVQTSQRLGSVFEVPAYVLFPLLSLVNNTGYPVTVPVLILLFTSYVCTNSFYVAIATAVNTATGPDRRGEINGLSMTCTSLARSISAIVFSSLFAFSVNNNHTYPFDYHLAFYLVALTRLVVAWLGWSRIRDVVNMEGHDDMYQGRE